MNNKFSLKLFNYFSKYLLILLIILLIIELGSKTSQLYVITRMTKVKKTLPESEIITIYPPGKKTDIVPYIIPQSAQLPDTKEYFFIQRYKKQESSPHHIKSFTFKCKPENEDIRESITLISYFYLAFTIIVGIAVLSFLIWIYVAYKNLLRFDTQGLKYSSKWAIISGFVVPFVNLIRPYQMVREIWQATSTKSIHDETSRENIPPSTLIRLWWLMILTNIATIILLKTEIIPYTNLFIYYAVLPNLLWLFRVFTYIVSMLVIKKIYDKQKKLLLIGEPALLK